MSQQGAAERALGPSPTLRDSSPSGPPGPPRSQHFPAAPTRNRVHGQRLKARVPDLHGLPAEGALRSPRGCGCPSPRLARCGGGVRPLALRCWETEHQQPQRPMRLPGAFGRSQRAMVLSPAPGRSGSCRHPCVWPASGLPPLQSRQLVQSPIERSCEGASPRSNMPNRSHCPTQIGRAGAPHCY